MVTIGHIADIVKLKPSQVEKILRLKHGPEVKARTVERVFAVAVKLGFDFATVNFVERREHRRRPVTIRTRISIVRKNGRVYDKGQATIRDLSVGGARITDVKLPKSSFPTEPFSIVIEPLRGGDGARFNAELVRVIPGKPYGYGVKFGKFVPGGAKKKKKK